MNEIGRIMVMTGAGLVVLGAVLWGLSHVPALRNMGSLPGDVRLHQGNLQIYFPITTMILVSIVLSLLMIGVQWLRRP